MRYCILIQSSLVFNLFSSYLLLLSPLQASTSIIINCIMPIEAVNEALYPTCDSLSN